MPEPGNPILVEMLKDWWDEAKQLGLKSSSAYKRAHDSMKACPVTFNHPCEATKLAGIGPDICNRLVHAYEAYCAANGLPPPQRACGAQRRQVAQAIDAYLAEPLPAPKRRRRAQQPAAYVPKKRSGAYALMLALHAIDETEGCATKERLVALAQPHCDASFTAPSDPSKTYTAWSSMGTLVRKHLVHQRRGNPKRYSLTEEGLEIADGIVRADSGTRLDAGGGGVWDGADGETVGGDADEEDDGVAPVADDDAGGGWGQRQRAREEWLRRDEETAARRRQRRAAYAPANNSFIIPDDDDGDGGDDDVPNHRSDREKRADIEAQRHRLQLLYRGQANYEYGAARPAPSAEQLAVIDLEAAEVRRQVLSGGLATGGLEPVPPAATAAAAAAAAVPPRPLASSPAKSRRRSAPSSTRHPTLSSTNPRELSAPSPTNPRQLSASSPTNPRKRSAPSSSRASAAPRTSTATRTTPLPSTAASTAARTTPLPSTAAGTASARATTTPTPAPTPTPATLAHFNPTTLLAGTYSIQLVLDCREVRTKSDRDYIQNGLMKAGITPATRALSLGDALWVARSGEHEVVLDYIVERKRLDDLVLSIRDGRFHEQKFRLLKGAVENVVYIVEDFSLPEHVRDDPTVQRAIDTAISSMQVAHGFFVKRTRMLDDTIRYLARLTRMLQDDVYADKDLLVLPDHRTGYPYPASLQVLREQLEQQQQQQARPPLSRQRSSRDYYLPYDTFSALVAKSACTTLRDVHIRMLMCVRGVTAAKAVEIQRHFKTPLDLVEAYERAQGEAEREDLLMNSCGSGNAIPGRKIGAAVSRRIMQVWWGGGDGDESY